MSKFFLYLRTDTFRKNLIYVLITVVVLFVLIYFGLRLYTKHGDRQEVPNLRGKHISEAIQILKKADLEYKVDSIYQLDAKPGVVIDQDPEGRAAVKSGRTVYLTIITQVAPDVQFPEIEQKTLVEALSIIKNNSLKLGDTIYRNDIARDVVLEAKFGGQPISAGRTIPKGSRIDLVLGNGKGEDEVNVPELVGLPYTEAEFALRGAGLVVGSISFNGNSKDTLNSIVVAQSPDSAMALIPLGSAVHITLGKPEIATPEETIAPF